MDLSILNDAAALCNAKQDSGLHQMLLHCCGSKRWVTEMTTKLPVRDFMELCQAADAVDATLTQEDWLEAFAAHPRVCLMLILYDAVYNCKEYIVVVILIRGFY